MKTHKWQGEQLVITLTDGPAMGEYRPISPIPDSDGLLTLGVAKVDGCDRRLRTQVTDFPGLAAEIAALEAKWQAEWRNQPTRCERCGDVISGEQITWESGKSCLGIYQTPYCQGCARLLRIFA
jgi:hypothetical protein